MTRSQSFKRLADIQRLLEARAEGELAASRHALHAIENAMAVCAIQVREAVFEGNEALSKGNTHNWLVAGLSREVAVWQNATLQLQRNEAKQKEEEVRAIFLEKRLAAEQSSTMLQRARDMEAMENNKREQKMLDEFALQNRARLSNP
ncbi:MAG: hypothetical protein JSS87_13540 [Acidobacteria bacterium]|nr:hypothetical protein [Acidobacteriota bacterium]